MTPALSKSCLSIIRPQTRVLGLSLLNNRRLPTSTGVSHSVQARTFFGTCLVPCSELLSQLRSLAISQYSPQQSSLFFFYLNFTDPASPAADALHHPGCKVIWSPYRRNVAIIWRPVKLARRSFSLKLQPSVLIFRVPILLACILCNRMNEPVFVALRPAAIQDVQSDQASGLVVSVQSQSR